MQKGDGHSSRDFKTTKTRDQISESFNFFVDGGAEVQARYIRRLKAIRATLEASPFFSNHEVNKLKVVAHLGKRTGTGACDCDNKFTDYETLCFSSIVDSHGLKTYFLFVMQRCTSRFRSKVRSPYSNIIEARCSKGP